MVRCFTFVEQCDILTVQSMICKILKRRKLMNTEDFGKKILSIRQNANLTQEELALWMGVTPQAISKWERGGFRS